MSLCINPDCPQPDHPDNSQGITCQRCGSDLLLQGRYQVMRVLSSRTGFGTVYEAYERDQPKILKVLKRDRSDNPKVVELFRQEARVLSRLRHPGVPLVEENGYFTFAPAGGGDLLHCIVMERIDGSNLKQWMQQQGNHPINEKQAIQWLLQLIDILRRVHQQNYFHRDIKPDNVMLRANGQLVLVDFGAVREMTQTYLAQVGSLGVTTVSSAGYTPPEQEQGQAVPQSDFYALGRTVIYLLTAKSPNDSDIYDPLTNTFNWRGFAPQISADLADLLDSMVAPRVIDRPKTAQEILDRLHKMAVEHRLHNGGTLLPETTLNPDAAPLTVPQTLTTRVEPAPFSRWTWVIGGGVGLLGVGIIAFGLWQQRPGTPVGDSSQTQVGGTVLGEAAPVPETPVTLRQTLTDHTSPINGLLLLSDGRRLLSASADSTIRLWDLSTGSLLKTLSGHTRFVNAIALSPDESVLYSSSADGMILQWDLETGTVLQQWPPQPSAINALGRTPDGQRLVSGAADGSLKVWDARTGKEIRTLGGHPGSINALVVTADGQRIVSGGSDRTIKVWDIQTGNELLTLPGHESFINALAVSPSGRFLFSASADATIRRWALDTGEPLDVLTGHRTFVNTLAVSRDGQTLSSGSADGTVRVWNAETGEPLQVLTGFGMPVDHLVVPSARQLITASRENPAIKVWTREQN